MLHSQDKGSGGETFPCSKAANMALKQIWKLSERDSKRSVGTDSVGGGTGCHAVDGWDALELNSIPRAFEEIRIQLTCFQAGREGGAGEGSASWNPSCITVETKQAALLYHYSLGPGERPDQCQKMSLALIPNPSGQGG